MLYNCAKFHHFTAKMLSFLKSELMSLKNALYNYFVVYLQPRFLVAILAVELEDIVLVI